MSRQLSAICCALLAIGVFSLAFAATVQNPEPAVLSDHALLFPAANVPVYKKIEASAGCWQWTVDDPMVVELESGPRTGACVDSVIVRTVPRTGAAGMAPSYTVVRAVDYSTSMELVCEVYVGKLHRLEILTTFRTMYVGVYEVLRLQGFDVEGNVFSSLDGILFDWATKRLVDSPGEDLAFRRARSQDKQLSTSVPPERRDIIAAYASSVGQISVSACCGTVCASAQFHVVDKLEVEPRDAPHLFPGASVQLRLFRRTKKQRVEVQLPSDRYIWMSSNDSAVSVDMSSGRCTAVSLGQVVITVMDSFYNASRESVSVVGSKVSGIDVSITHEVAGSQPVLSLLKLGQSDFVQNWNLISGTNYTLRAIATDIRGERVLMPHSFSGLSCDSVSSDCHCSVSTGLEMHLECGSAVQSSLTVRFAHGDDLIEVTKLLRVSRRLTLDPQVVVLPFADGVTHRVAVVRSTVFGSVRCFSLSSSVTVISPEWIESGALGTGSVLYFDAANPLNFAELIVHVEPVGELKPRPGTRQTVVSHPLPLVLDGVSIHGRSFANISRLPVVVSAPSTLLVNRSPPGSDSSVVFVLQQDHVGWADMSFQAGSSRPVSLKVGFFDPLTLESPNTESVLVAVGSSVALTLSRGPLQNIAVGTKTRVSVFAAYGNDTCAQLVDRTIRCLQTCTMGVIAKLSTVESDAAIHSVSSEVKLDVACSAFSSYVLSATSLSNQSPLPIEQGSTKSSRWTVSAIVGSSFSLQLTPVDFEGRMMYNASQSIPSCTHMIMRPDVIEVVSPSSIGEAPYISYSMIIRGRSAVSGSAVLLLECSHGSLEVELRFLEAIIAQPSSLLLFLHPSARESVMALGGSSTFDFVLSDPSLVSVIQDKPSGMSLTSPVSPSSTLTLRIVDKIHHDLFATVPVVISPLQKISLFLPDQVIPVGSKVNVSVFLFGADGAQFSSAVASLAALSFEEQSGQSGSLFLSRDFLNVFEFSCSKPGPTSLRFVGRNVDRSEVHSEWVVLYCYQPLHVSPSSLSLLIGSSEDVILQRGFSPLGLPARQTGTHGDGGVVRVSKSSGYWTIDAAAVGRANVCFEEHISVDSKVKTTSACLDVEVVPLTGIDIDVPSADIFTREAVTFGIVARSRGRLVPVRNAPIRVEWSLSDVSGIVVAPLDALSRFIAISSVHNKSVALEAVCTIGSDKFAQSVQVRFWDRLSLTPSSPELVMWPGSSIRLVANQASRLRVAISSADNNCGRLVGDSLLQAQSAVCKDFVVVESLGPCRDRLVVPLYVEQPAFLEVLDQLNHHAPFVVPVHQSAFFRLSVRDKFGRKFNSEGSVPLEVHSTSLSLSVSDAGDKGLRVHGNYPGRALVSVYVRAFNLSIGFEVTVASLVQPAETTLFVGTRRAFRLELPSTISARSATWNSTDAAVLQIDRSSGSAVAVGSGEAFVVASLTGFSFSPSARVKVTRPPHLIRRSRESAICLTKSSAHVRLEQMWDIHCLDGECWTILTSNQLVPSCDIHSLSKAIGPSFFSCTCTISDFKTLSCAVTASPSTSTLDGVLSKLPKELQLKLAVIVRVDQSLDVTHPILSDTVDVSVVPQLVLEPAWVDVSRPEERVLIAVKGGSSSLKVHSSSTMATAQLSNAERRNVTVVVHGFELHQNHVDITVRDEVCGLSATSRLRKSRKFDLATPASSPVEAPARDQQRGHTEQELESWTHGQGVRLTLSIVLGIVVLAAYHALHG